MAATPEDIPDFLSSLPDYVATVRFPFPSRQRVISEVCKTDSARKATATLQVPDEFTEYFMERSGIDISDPRLCAPETSLEPNS